MQPEAVLGPCYNGRMTTISVSLDDETYARLKAVADAEGKSVEELVVESAVALAVNADDELSARVMATRHLRRYPLLFERLGE